MANNRYYITCPKCWEEQFLWKSLWEWIYNTRAEDKWQTDLVNEIYDFMWKHIEECHKDKYILWEIFSIISK